MKKVSLYLFAVASMMIVACNSSGNEGSGASPIEEHSATDKSVEGENVESPTTASSSAASPGMGGAVNTHAAAADTTEHVQE